MYINFNYKGSTYKADLSKDSEGNQILVKLNDSQLGKQFGSALHFYIKNRRVEFDSSNPAHSELFALQSSIKNAIAEQARSII